MKPNHKKSGLAGRLVLHWAACGSRVRLAGLVALAAWCWGLGTGLFSSSGDRTNVLLFAVLALLLGWNALLPGRNAEPDFKTRATAWVFLLLTLPVAFLPSVAPGYAVNAGLVCAVFGVMLHLAGWRSALRLLPCVTLSVLVVPFEEQLALAFSYPLRLFSTVLSVESAQWLALPVEGQLTSITIGEAEIAITDACSGISQLAVLALLGYLVVRHRHRSVWFRLLHYLCLLPVIIVANWLRLLLTIILYCQRGTEVLYDPYHSLLGYLLVVVTLVLFWAIGWLFPDAGPEEGKVAR